MDGHGEQPGPDWLIGKKNTCKQMVLGKKQKRQVVVGKVTPKLNGQQTAHPGPGHLRQRGPVAT